MNHKLTAAIAAGTLTIGLLVGAAGAVALGAGSSNDSFGRAQMHGGYGTQTMGGSMMGGSMMGGSIGYDDMLNEMREHMGLDGSSQ